MNRNQPINPLSRFFVLLALLLTGAAAQPAPAAAPPEAELQRMQTCGSSVTDITRILRQADLPFALSGVQLGTDPDCSPTGVLGSGTISPALIKGILARAGYSVNVDGMSAAPPDLFPAFTSETSINRLTFSPGKLRTSHRWSFGICLNSDAARAQVQAQQKQITAAGVTSTPSVFVDGELVTPTFEALSAAIDSAVPAIP